MNDKILSCHSQNAMFPSIGEIEGNKLILMADRFIMRFCAPHKILSHENQSASDAYLAKLKLADIDS